MHPQRTLSEQLGYTPDWERFWREACVRGRTHGSQHHSPYELLSLRYTPTGEIRYPIVTIAGWLNRNPMNVRDSIVRAIRIAVVHGWGRPQPRA